VIFTLRRAGPVGLEKVRAVLEDRGFGRVPAHEIARLAWSCGALDEARALAARHAEAARRDLLACERSPCLEALGSLPELLLARDR
ncbi:MAG TPA: hypothetical protein VFQ51_07835, partial [Vicinamibacteria bacterium]|nr:hypothetical protein [Vicinamibacteria bacterium]